jgi:hypothetical protein
MLKENIKVRRLKNRPVIISYLKLSENHQSLILVIKNIGEGMAKNVKAKLHKEFYRYNRNDIPLSEYGIFKYGFSIFPPQYELCYPINFSSELDNMDENAITIEIVYQDINDQEIIEKYHLEINQVTGQGYNNPPDSYLGQIPFYLNEIKKILKTNS